VCEVQTARRNRVRIIQAAPLAVGSRLREQNVSFFDDLIYAITLAGFGLAHAAGTTHRSPWS
jgi:hypothetical protein